MPSPLSIITPEQQALFAIGTFASLSSSATGNDIDHATFEAITTALGKAAPTIGTWNIVWGPSVVQQPLGPEVAMNTMYVVQSAANPSQYAIAVAGTNPGSILDWIIEDGLVHWQVPWIYALFDAPGARISLGTAIGLAVLQTMTPSSSVPGGGTTLVDFLATITGQPVQISVVGHSLGGALAPTVALWLADTQGLLSPWDPDQNATLSALPTAGPTAGNGAFAAYTGKKLGARLTPYYNTLDVVPHAWQTSMLEQIPALYEPHIPELAVISDLVDLAIDLSDQGDYTQLPGLTALPGAFHKVSGIFDLERYLREVAYQHTTAYDGWFHFNPAWYAAARPAPAIPSAERIAALSATADPRAIAQALRLDAPRQLQIGDRLVDAPVRPDDPRGPEAVALVTAELQKHGTPPATPPAPAPSVDRAYPTRA